MLGVAARWAILLLAVVVVAWGSGARDSGADGSGASATYVRGPVTTLIDNAARVAWSTEGTIYFDRAGADGFYDVWRMNEDGTQVACLTCGHPGLPQRHIGNPESVPGGRYLIFQVEKAAHDTVPQWVPEPGIGRFNDLWALDLKTMAAYQLTNVSSTGTSGTLHPQASHDGTRLFWSQIEGPTAQYDNMALVVANFVTTPTPHLENAIAYNPGPDPTWMEAHGWGPNDDYLYFTCTPLAGMNDYAMDICRMDFATPTQVTRLTNTSGLSGEPAEWDEHAHLSPNGDVMAWMSSAPYGSPVSDVVGELKTELWLMNADGSGSRRITFLNQVGHADYLGSRAIASDLDWNKDGTKIAMRVQTPGAALWDRIILIDLCADADTNATCDVRETEFPAGAIDVQTDTMRPEDDLLVGSVRYLPSQPASGSVWKPEVFGLDVDTMTYHRLTWMADVTIRHFALSPDRTKLALTKIPADTNGSQGIEELDDNYIWVVDLAAGKAWRLTEAGATSGPGGLDWLDNETIVTNYGSPGPFAWNIAKIDARTGEREYLTDTPQIMESDTGVSPDRTLISFAASDSTQNWGTDEFGPIPKPQIWVMNADGTNKRQVTDGGSLIGRFGLSGAGDFDSEISPDNSKIVFGRTTALGNNDPNPNDGIPGNGTHHIFVADMTTLQVTDLTPGATSVSLIPDWDYDGNIYYTEMAHLPEHAPNYYLGVSRTTQAGGVTRLESQVVSEVWKGAFVAKLVPGLDGDVDGAPDEFDNCDAWPNPSQAMPPWPVMGDDADCDGFTSALETDPDIATDPNDGCANTMTANDETDDKWPPDFTDNRTVNTLDLTGYATRLGTVPATALDRRHDLNQNGLINTLDLVPFAVMLGKTCS